jgi:drug/metabolite transporter (DMT)-like permease
MLGRPMLPLALSTLFSAGFSIWIRFAQKRGADMVVVGSVNYLTAAVFQAVAAAAGGIHLPQPMTIAIALGGGIAYASAFFLLQAFMRQRGVSVTGAVTRMSVLVPVGVSLLAWGESASGVQAAGIALAVVSLPFLSLGAGSLPRGELHPGRRRMSRGRSAALLAGLFVVNGICLLAPRAFRQVSPPRDDSLFLCILFATAAACACGAWAFQERRKRHAPERSRAPAPDRTAVGAPLLASVLPGLAVGLCNALASSLIVVSLRQLPGIIVYPFYSAVGLLATVAFSRVIWKEKIRALEGIGIALALASIVLVNLA